MTRQAIVLCMCGLLVMSAAAPLALAADMASELDAIRKSNEDLLARIDALEKKTAPASAAPGRFDLGGGTTFKISGDVRVRNEHLKNSLDMDNSSEFARVNWTRLRTRLGVDVDYQNAGGAFIQLTNEMRWGTKNKFSVAYDQDDIEVDNAFVRLNFPNTGVRYLKDMPILLTVGRQDLLARPERGWGGMYGEGWLLFDGTPFDGSKTIGFDAVKARFSGIEGTTVDLMYAKINTARQPAGGLSPFHKHGTRKDDEDMYALYVITDALKYLTTDLYVINRNKNWMSNYRTAGNEFEDPRLNTTVFGGRIATKDPIMNGLVSWCMQGGYQTGTLRPENRIGLTEYTQNRVDRDAFAFYTWAKIHAGKAMNMEQIDPEFQLRFDYYSGDDPNTGGRYEGWDSMYAEWPNYSELMIFNRYDGFAAFHGGTNPNLGAWTNIYFPSFAVTIRPEALKKQAWVTLTYRYMLADEKSNPGGRRKVGDLYQFYTAYTIAKGVRGHFLFDYFHPGGYFARDNRSDSWMARAEIMYSF